MPSPSPIERLIDLIAPEGELLRTLRRGNAIAGQARAKLVQLVDEDCDWSEPSATPVLLRVALLGVALDDPFHPFNVASLRDAAHKQRGHVPPEALGRACVHAFLATDDLGVLDVVAEMLQGLPPASRDAALDALLLQLPTSPPARRLVVDSLAHCCRGDLAARRRLIEMATDVTMDVRLRARAMRLVGEHAGVEPMIEGLRDGWLTDDALPDACAAIAWVLDSGAVSHQQARDLAALLVARHDAARFDDAVSGPLRESVRRVLPQLGPLPEVVGCFQRQLRAMSRCPLPSLTSVDHGSVQELLTPRTDDGGEEGTQEWAAAAAMVWLDHLDAPGRQLVADAARQRIAALASRNDEWSTRGDAASVSAACALVVLERVDPRSALHESVEQLLLGIDPRVTVAAAKAAMAASRSLGGDRATAVMRAVVASSHRWIEEAGSLARQLWDAEDEALAPVEREGLRERLAVLRSVNLQFDAVMAQPWMRMVIERRGTALTPRPMSVGLEGGKDGAALPGLEVVDVLNALDPVGSAELVTAFLLAPEHSLKGEEVVAAMASVPLAERSRVATRAEVVATGLSRCADADVAGRALAMLHALDGERAASFARTVEARAELSAAVERLCSRILRQADAAPAARRRRPTAPRAASTLQGDGSRTRGTEEVRTSGSELIERPGDAHGPGGHRSSGLGPM